MAFNADQQKRIKQILAKYHTSLKNISAEHRTKVLGAVKKYDDQKVQNLHDKIKSA